MEEVDAILDVVLDEHALRVAADQWGGRSVQLIGQQQGGFFMPQIRDDQLPQRAGIAWQEDLLIEDSNAPLGERILQRPIDPKDISEADLL